MYNPLCFLGVFLPGLLSGEARAPSGEHNGVFTMQQSPEDSKHRAYVSPESYPFRNTSLPWKDRVNDLVSRLTLDELNDQVSSA